MRAHFLCFVRTQPIDVNPTHRFINDAPFIKGLYNEVKSSVSPFSLMSISSLCLGHLKWTNYIFSPSNSFQHNSSVFMLSLLFQTCYYTDKRFSERNFERLICFDFFCCCCCCLTSNLTVESQVRSHAVSGLLSTHMPSEPENRPNGFIFSLSALFFLLPLTLPPFALWLPSWPVY